MPRETNNTSKVDEENVWEYLRMLDLKVVYASMDSLERICMFPDQEHNFPVQVMCSERLARRGHVGKRALLHSLELHGKAREACQGLMGVATVSMLGWCYHGCR
jgi:hypothetical protein